MSVLHIVPDEQDFTKLQVLDYCCESTNRNTIKELQAVANTRAEFLCMGIVAVAVSMVLRWLWKPAVVPSSASNMRKPKANLCALNDKDEEEMACRTLEPILWQRHSLFALVAVGSMACPFVKSLWMDRDVLLFIWQYSPMHHVHQRNRCICHKTSMLTLLQKDVHWRAWQNCQRHSHHYYEQCRRSRSLSPLTLSFGKGDLCPISKPEAHMSFELPLWARIEFWVTNGFSRTMSLLVQTSVAQMWTRLLRMSDSNHSVYAR